MLQQMILGASSSDVPFEDIIKLVGVAGGLSVIMIYIVFANWRKAVVVREREETRRELAAYVAEGSITAEDAARLVGADVDEQEARIKKAMADGWISPKKAEEMLNVVRKAREA